MNDQLDTTDLWIGAHYWDSAARPKMTLGELLTRSELFIVSLTGGGLDDLLSLGVLGRHGDTKQWMHWGRAWADRAILDLRPGIADDLAEFADAGELTLVDDLMTEPTPQVVEMCQSLRNTGKLAAQPASIAVESDGINWIIDALIDAGFDYDALSGVSQGDQIGAAVRETPVMLKNQTLVHCDQRHMRWCVHNAKIEPIVNSIITTRTKSRPVCIDPLLALFTAGILMRQDPERSACYTLAAETGGTDHA